MEEVVKKSSCVLSASTHHTQPQSHQPWIWRTDSWRPEPQHCLGGAWPQTVALPLKINPTLSTPSLCLLMQRAHNFPKSWCREISLSPHHWGLGCWPERSLPSVSRTSSGCLGLTVQQGHGSKQSKIKSFFIGTSFFMSKSNVLPFLN